MQATTRISNPETLDLNAIEDDLKVGNEVIIQFTYIPKSQLLSDINILCSKHNSNFNVRFYGDAYGTFDCKILHKIPHVKSLSLDCIMHAKDLDVLAELSHLQSLDLGIYQLQETEILQSESFKNLTKLSLGTVKTNALNLAYLSSYVELKSLVICVHTKNIEAVGSISHLESLGLYSVSKVPLNFVNNLHHLKAFKLLLGGRDNFDEIEENTIEYMDICRVRGFNNFNNLANFKALKTLVIDEQIQLKSLDINENLAALTSLRLRDCKTFASLTGLKNLTSLEHLQIWKTNLKFESLLTLGLPKTLKAFSFCTTKKKEDLLINLQLLALGYREATWQDFESAH